MSVQCLAFIALSAIARAQTLLGRDSGLEGLGEIAPRAVVIPTVVDPLMKVHANFGWATYGFWGSILFIGIANNLFTHIYHLTIGSGTSDIEGGDGSAGSARKAAGKHPVGKAQAKVWGCTIPTRLEGLVVAAFWILSIVLCAVKHGPFAKPIIAIASAPPLYRHLATRTGTLCISNLPFVWAFGIRNNVFLWATGWSFSTFNLFHRHIARVSTIQAILHGVMYTVTYLRNDPTGTVYRFTVKLRWFQFGIVAVVALCLLAFSSISAFRRKRYEMFLIVHLALSSLSSDNDPEKYEPYIWSLVALLVFDRALRIFRLVYCNLHITLNKGKTIAQPKTIVRYDPEGDILRIEVAISRTHPSPAPGQHYFLYQPGRLQFYESHPFTLASWTSADDATTPEKSAGSTAEGEVGLQGPKLVFMVRPQDGWTKRLRDKCVAAEHNTTTPTILVEGPYGKREPLWAYDHVLIVVGGSGITAGLPYLVDHAQRRASGAKCRTRRVTLVWANRTESYVRAVASRELAVAAARADVELAFYVTSEGAAVSKGIAVGDEDTSAVHRGGEGVGEKEIGDAAVLEQSNAGSASGDGEEARSTCSYCG
ncbi:unnamed protein product [Parascedosporium putredinis]|uniref:FAD-binding FR-type domain-containing protein n=1 Tax=Parascedosporium putredinis TaxID=1442378 RepID=A0A9P1M7F6_9PEZI|nr:unnamed protein product [Parascedosporium putredinis]CAI7991598.1 unnamed protein product [Parascedosporium putredinis]